MSKILLYTDVHLSTSSSIIRKRGHNYSDRLENVIKSVTWAENKAVELGCDEIICLGDFFDKPILNDEELTALTEIQWSNLPHTFIVGNHESSVDGLRFNSVKSLQGFNFNIVSEVTVRSNDNVDLVFIPYILEENRKPLRDYLKKEKYNIIFSHNDIKGIRYGKIESPHGFELSEIEDCCKLFLNGHLHNGTFLNKNKTILNLGNLTGQNFGEDAFNYSHCALVVDTETFELTFIENPHAYNFYKIDIEKASDISRVKSKLKNNAVVSFRCLDSLEPTLRDYLVNESLINTYKINVYSDDNREDTTLDSELMNSVDHLKQFRDFILEQLGSSKVVQEEVYEVCK